MSEPTKPQHDPERPNEMRALAGGIVGLVLVFAVTIGFVIMPIVQGKQVGLDPWSSICRALGISPGTPAAVQPTDETQARPVTDVAWRPDILDRLAHGDRARGQQLVTDTCSSCHGENGVSPSADFPHLAGQSAAAIYKQLHDYKSGARQHPQMTPVAMQLSEEQLADVAAFLAKDNVYLSLGRRDLVADEHIERLVRVGDPSRGIPSCNACHGSGTGGPIETPTIVGQHAEYLERQLDLYASGERRNDIYRRMRAIASRLTPEERKLLAEYYQGTS